MKAVRVLGVFGLVLLFSVVGQIGLAYSTATPLAQGAMESGPIIIDHTCTDLGEIPQVWIERARDLAIHYAHTSHGSQLVSYLDELENANSLYNVSYIRAGATPPTSLNCAPDSLCIYDGNPPETAITPGDYWAASDGILRTEAVADTGLFDASMWSWCGEASDYNETQIQTYLDVMTDWDASYMDMRFILMTGHTDGGSATLAQNNAMIRQYAQDQDLVLFDFADIETYDPLGGGPYDNDGAGTCQWCQTFCTAHPAYCTDLPDDCAHSDAPPEAALFCKLKSQAFWWMMARLAGWDGITGERFASVSSGPWQVGATWVAGAVPGAGDVVTITTGTTVTLGADAQCDRLFIESGSILIIPDGLSLTVREAVVNQGTLQQTRAVNNDRVAFLEMTDVYGVARYRGVEIESSENLGLVTVTVRVLGDGESCTSSNAASPPYARRCVEITAHYDAGATVCLWADEDEMQGLTNPRLFRYVEPLWTRLDAGSALGTSGLYTYVEAETQGFSHFLIGEADSAPTSVTQLNVAVPNKHTVILVALCGLFLIGTLMVIYHRET